MRGMNPLPSPGSWLRKAIGILLLVVFLPVLLAAVVRVVNDMLAPVMPYIVVLVILLGLYRLIISRYRS